MRKPLFMGEMDLVASADSEGGGGPLTDSVQRQDCCLLERGGEEGAGGVGLMMFGEDIRAMIPPVQTTVHFPGKVEFLSEPQRDRLKERPKPHRCIGQIRLEAAIEFEERLVVKRDVVQLRGSDACFGQAVVDRVLGKTIVMFLSREPLFLSGGDNLSVADQRSGAVVVESGNTEDSHGRSTQATGR